MAFGITLNIKKVSTEAQEVWEDIMRIEEHGYICHPPDMDDKIKAQGEQLMAKFKEIRAIIEEIDKDMNDCHSY